MAERGLEHGEHKGLGWIEGDVVRLAPPRPPPENPPMGRDAHSYCFAAADPARILAHTGYGGPVTAMIARDNMAGTQFHPEKSQALGLALIGNFLKWRP